MIIYWKNKKSWSQIRSMIGCIQYHHSDCYWFFKFRSTYMRPSIHGFRPFSCKINTYTVRCKDSHWFQALTALYQDTTKCIPVQSARGTLCPRLLQVSEIYESRQYHVVSTHSTLTWVRGNVSVCMNTVENISQMYISHSGINKTPLDCVTLYIRHN